MRSCNVDEFEYHRAEELPILCRYNFWGQFFYSFLITTRFCCIIVDYQDGRPPPFFFPSFQRFVWFFSFWICPIGSPKQYRCTSFCFPTCASEFQSVSALLGRRLLSSSSPFLSLWGYRDTIPEMLLSCPYFVLSSLGRTCQIRLSNHSSSIWNIGGFSWSRKFGIPS